MLGLAKMLAGAIASKDKKDQGSTAKGEAVGPSTAQGGSGSSAGYMAPTAHLSAAPQGVGHAALAQANAGGHYGPGMASAAPVVSGPPSPNPAPSAVPGSQANVHQGLSQFFGSLANSGQIAAGMAPTHNQPLPQSQGLPVAQNTPAQGLGLGRYFLSKINPSGGMA